jgi:hypothetical protein
MSTTNKEVVGNINPAVENISPDDLIILREGQAKMNALDVEKTTINNFVINLFVKKYKLQAGDNLDVETGTITRAPKPESNRPNEQTPKSQTEDTTPAIQEHPSEKV